MRCDVLSGAHHRDAICLAVTGTVPAGVVSLGNNRVYNVKHQFPKSLQIEEGRSNPAQKISLFKLTNPKPSYFHKEVVPAWQPELFSLVYL